MPPIVHDVLRSPGQPIDAATRAFIEPRFGHDFSAVRVHTDAKAAESALAVNALAYTVGRDVVFGAGQYAPRTRAGRWLMAHELTHTAQQRPASAGSRLVIGPAEDGWEIEADTIAGTVASAGDGESMTVASQAPAAHLSTHRQILQRVSFGSDGTLAPDLQATVRAAAEIAERRIMASDFEPQWKSFWDRFGKTITPQPSLGSYRAAVRERVIHDMDSSTNEKVKEFLKEEKTLPLERQTAAVTVPGSRDTFMRRFAIQQGVDSVVSLLLHESWHGAGLGMGLFEAFEVAFHQFETAVGYPLMMGGAKIERVQQKRRGDTGVDVTITYTLHKIGKDPLPAKIELRVAEGDEVSIVHQEPIPSSVGRATTHWHAENPGWNSYSIRIHNVDEDSLMSATRIETDPRCVLGVSTMHCEND